MAKEETSSIAAVLKKVQKDYDLRVGPLSLVAEDVEAISSGNIAIDDITEVGGLPIGRSVELYGPPSSGKTTTALMAAVNLQKEIIASGREEYILYSDFEHALDRKYAEALGLDLDHRSFLFCQPDNLEQGTNMAIDLIQTGFVRMGIWDSVAAMTPEDMLTSEVGKVTVALQARLLSSFLKKLNPMLDANRCCAVFLNHLHEVIEMGGYKPSGPPRTTTPGGRALKHYASVRIEYQQIKNITAPVLDQLTNTEIKRVEATNVRVRVVKNKVGSPFREATVRVRFGRGFDNFWTAMQILTGRGVIPLTSGYYYFEKAPSLVHEDMDTSSTGRRFVRGEEVLLEFADRRPEWRAAVISYTRDLVSGKTMKAPVEIDTKLSEPVIIAPTAVVNPMKVVPKEPTNGSKTRTVGLDSLIGDDDQLFRADAVKEG